MTDERLDQPGTATLIRLRLRAAIRKTPNDYRAIRKVLWSSKPQNPEHLRRSLASYEALHRMKRGLWDKAEAVKFLRDYFKAPTVNIKHYGPEFEGDPLCVLRLPNPNVDPETGECLRCVTRDRGPLPDDRLRATSRQDTRKILFVRRMLVEKAPVIFFSYACHKIMKAIREGREYQYLYAGDCCYEAEGME